MPRISGWTPAATPRKSTPDVGAARFELTSSLETGMKEASDVAALPGGRFVVVGDRANTAVLIDAKGKKASLDLPGLKNGRSQLEGVAYDPVRNHLFVAREEARELVRYEWDALDKTSKAVEEKRFDLPDEGPRNKGVEGLAYIPEDISPTGQPQLLLANEGNPRKLLMLGDGGKGKPLPVKLEREVYSACHDFSAMAIDPVTGHLFISSDESATVVQVKLARDGDKIVGKLVQAFPIRDEKGKAMERVEGLAFNEKGDLFVLTENDGRLHQLARR